MGKKSGALLVVDVQVGLVAKKLYAKDEMLATVEGAIRAYRDAGELVVFVQHCGGAVRRDTAGWEILPALDRRPEDPLVLKTQGNAFLKTELGGVLEERGVREILVCGLVTHGCVRATCLGGLAQGLRVRLLEGGHSNWAKDAKDKIDAVEAELARAGVEIAGAGLSLAADR
jgi:nicotinamidase-related amidase